MSDGLFTAGHDIAEPFGCLGGQITIPPIERRLVDLTLWLKPKSSSRLGLSRNETGGNGNEEMPAICHWRPAAKRKQGNTFR